MRKREWNRFPPPSWEEKEPLTKDNEQLEKRELFLQTASLAASLPFTLNCPRCTLPLGRDELVIRQGGKSDPPGFWEALCPSCAETKA